MLAQAQGLLGIAALLALSRLATSDRASPFPARFVAGALLLQVLLALAIVRVPAVKGAIGLLNGAVAAVERATRRGSSYMFGYLGGGDLPFALAPGAQAPIVIAFEVLPLVIVLSALSALLWHWGVLKAAVRLLSRALRASLEVSGAVGLGGGATLFLGVVETPLVLRAFLPRVSRAELFTLMVLILATISGALLVLYATTLRDAVPDALGHMISASILSLPAAILVARLMEPGPATTEADLAAADLAYAGSMDALVRGAMEGVQLFLAVIGVIITVFALVALVDEALGLLPGVAGAPLTLRRLFGWLFAPLLFAVGVPWAEAGVAGALMGTKAVLNEYVAFLDLAALPAGSLSPRSALIVSYALCGVANLASIGLIVSAIGTLAPGRRAEVAALGVRAWAAGNAATLLTGAVIGLVTPVA